MSKTYSASPVSIWGIDIWHPLATGLCEAKHVRRTEVYAFAQDLWIACCQRHLTFMPCIFNAAIEENSSHRIQSENNIKKQNCTHSFKIEAQKMFNREWMYLNLKYTGNRELWLIIYEKQKKNVPKDQEKW